MSDPFASAPMASDPYGMPTSPYGANPYGAPGYGAPGYGSRTPRRGGLPVLLDEQLLRVTMQVKIIKLNPVEAEPEVL